MLDTFVTLHLVHDGAALQPVGDLVAADAHDEVGVWEQLLGLHQAPGVAKVEHVVDPVAVDAHRTVGGRRQGLVLPPEPFQGFLLLLGRFWTEPFGAATSFRRFHDQRRRA